MKTHDTVFNSSIISGLKNELKIDATVIGSLYYKTTNTFPLTITYCDVVYDDFYTQITDHFFQLINDDILDMQYDESTACYRTKQRVLIIDENIFIRYEFTIYEESVVTIFYNHQSKKDILSHVNDFAINSIAKENNIGGKIGLLTSNGNGLCLKDFEIKNSDFNFDNNVNLISFNEKLITQLNKRNEKGIALITQISSESFIKYIRHLTSIVQKRFIYVDNQFSNLLGHPQFLKSILLENPNSILVLENSKAIENRKNNPNSAVSLLTNLADGLLADALSIQIIVFVEKKWVCPLIDLLLLPISIK